MSTISPPRSHDDTRPRHRRSPASTRLGRYTDERGRHRELVCRPGAGGSRLVIDRIGAMASDERLVAHLAADEPPENASIIASLYLADRRPRRCRRLEREDLAADPLSLFEHQRGDGSTDTAEAASRPHVDRGGRRYELRASSAGMGILELRWRCAACHDHPGQGEIVTLREVVGRLERYEPARTLTVRALGGRTQDSSISTTALRDELARLNASRIVLNRGLREAVLAAIERDGLSLSEIAIRCGRMKRGRDGSLISGETSWLGRRIGQLPEGGGDTPTPWIHSDTLALIARQGLGVAPAEVELG
jgi:hypothetical protein